MCCTSGQRSVPMPQPRITSMDTSRVGNAPGVVAVLDSSTVPGKNDCSPTIGDDPVFAESRVDFAGQVLFAVAAESELQARLACRESVVEYEFEEPVLTIEQALDRETFVLPSATIRRG